MTPRRRLPSAFDLDWENQKTPVWNQWTGANLARPPSSDVTEETEWHVSVVVRTRQLRRLVQLGIASASSLAWRWGLPMWTPISGIPELVGAIRRPPPNSASRELAGYQLAPLRRRRLSGSSAHGSSVADWAKLMTIPGSNVEPLTHVRRLPPPLPAAPAAANDVSFHESSSLRLKAQPRPRRGWAVGAMLLAALIGWSVGSTAFRKTAPPLERATFPKLPRSAAAPPPAASAQTTSPQTTSPPASAQTTSPTASAAVQPPAVEAPPVLQASAPATAALGRAPEPAAAETAGGSSVEAPRAAFDTARAAKALKLARGMAANCFDSGQTASSRVVVTFAPSGRVSSVKLLGLTAPEATRCVRAAFRRVKVPPFDGASLSVGKTFRFRG